jgi:hypothetical protein
MTALIMHLEKHSRADCKACDVFFLTTYKYTLQLLKLEL